MIRQSVIQGETGILINIESDHIEKWSLHAPMIELNSDGWEQWRPVGAAPVLMLDVVHIKPPKTGDWIQVHLASSRVAMPYCARVDRVDVLDVSSQRYRLQATIAEIQYT